MTTVPFPTKRPTQMELPAPRIWKPADLMNFLHVSKSWVYKRTDSRATDPIPRIQGIGLLRFDTHNAAFQDWMARHLGVDGIEEQR